MPAMIHKLDFSAPRGRQDVSSRARHAHAQATLLAPETEARWAIHRPASMPNCQDHEAVTAVLLALALHLAGYLLMPAATQEEPATPPAPIQVAWIAAPQPKAEHTPAAPPQPQPPMVKPKAKPKAVKRVKTQPKAVLSTRAPATTTTAALAETAEKTPKPAAEAPAAMPQASATPAPAAPATNSQPPLTLPNLNAGYLHNPAPRYPEEARERGEQGKVLVRALITVDGTVAELALRKSSGFAGLDQSALETVKKWRFVPARRGAAAVSAWVVVPITFSLEG